jgi:hypothetical protein
MTTRIPVADATGGVAGRTVKLHVEGLDDTVGALSEFAHGGDDLAVDLILPRYGTAVPSSFSACSRRR